MANILRITLTDDQGRLLGEVSLPTLLSMAQLVPRIQALLEEAEHPGEASGSRSADDERALRGLGNNKYLPLAEFLVGQEGPVAATFAEVERTLGSRLPATARGAHARSWWANTDTHTQGKAWLAVGWRTANVDPANERVEFRRTRGR